MMSWGMSLVDPYKEQRDPEVTVFRKDETLDRLADSFNVAQFASFAPTQCGPVLQFNRIAGIAPNKSFGSVKEAVKALFERSSEGAVNVRSFSEHQTQSREFIYGITSIELAVEVVERFAREGAYSIVNETIDISDGGVSGVVMGEVVEFRPDSTPRGVEKPGFASLPVSWAARLFKTVYGIEVDFSSASTGRLEFSLHPKPRGWKRSNIVFWEYSEESQAIPAVKPEWPNDFSRIIGDKAYGLLIAELNGLRVPKTTVIGRRVAPFTFGSDTGHNEVWIRTSPREQVPGKFTTARGWQDPFALLTAEDPDGAAISSVLAQSGVAAEWSGAAIETADGTLVIEGVKGTGERFMLGQADAEQLPAVVIDAVRGLHAQLQSIIGATRFEWVFDGSSVWIVQLHSGASISGDGYIVPGDAAEWINFNISAGLEALRALVASIKPETGIILDRQIGLTSHLADVLRKAGVPARVEPSRLC